MDRANWIRLRWCTSKEKASTNYAAATALPVATRPLQSHYRPVPTDPIAAWLRAYPPDVAKLAEAARKVIRRAVPSAVEKLRPGWQLIGYNAPHYFAFIAPKADYVMLGFEWGVMLPNLEGLLEGDGSQVRFVALRSAEMLRSHAVVELIRAAATLTPPPRRARQ